MKDIDVREALQRTHLKKFHNDESRIIPEMEVCNGEARIDIAVINGHMHGLEIKSGQDTLVRLSHQIESYSKVFDYLTLVVAETHLDVAQKMLPPYWGITRASMRHSVTLLKKVRSPRINKEVVTTSLCQLLWKDELLNLAKVYNFQSIPIKTTKPELCELLSKSVKASLLAESIRATLKARTSWRVYPRSQQNGDSFRQKPSLSGFQVQYLF